jgi:hypothetical protein
VTHLEDAVEHLKAAENYARAFMACVDDARASLIDHIEGAPAFPRDTLLALDANRDTLNRSAVRAEQVANSTARIIERLNHV